jgi:hypothetical protein
VTSPPRACYYNPQAHCWMNRRSNPGTHQHPTHTDQPSPPEPPAKQDTTAHRSAQTSPVTTSARGTQLGGSCKRPRSPPGPTKLTANRFAPLAANDEDSEDDEPAPAHKNGKASDPDNDNRSS